MNILRIYAIHTSYQNQSINQYINIFTRFEEQTTVLVLKRHIHDISPQITGLKILVNFMTSPKR